jgi:tRNA-specific 2-thiouridylase
MVAMSGGVDSSVAAALLLEAGLEVVGVTMKLWGGPSDTGCCSVADVDDARWAADRLGIEHHVFNFGDEFERDVVAPYVADHAVGRTPNPCIECNRHLKFDRLLGRADALGFDIVATGHHARIVRTRQGPRLGRGVDRAKDQAYVLHVLDAGVLDRLRLPIGTMTKTQVRAKALELGLGTATKPDSQDVCFITAAAGRRAFLGDRIPLRPARIVDESGARVGHVDAIELVTIGQRRGLGLGGGGEPRYVTQVDTETATVTVGAKASLQCDSVPLETWRWVGSPCDTLVDVQTSAHGPTTSARVFPDRVEWTAPRRRVAPGQSVVAFVDDLVVGGGIVGVGSRSDTQMQAV